MPSRAGGLRRGCGARPGERCRGRGARVCADDRAGAGGRRGAGGRERRRPRCCAPGTRAARGPTPHGDAAALRRPVRRRVAHRARPTCRAARRTAAGGCASPACAPRCSPRGVLRTSERRLTCWSPTSSSTRWSATSGGRRWALPHDRPSTRRVVLVRVAGDVAGGRGLRRRTDDAAGHDLLEGRRRARRRRRGRAKRKPDSSSTSGTDVDRAEDLVGHPPGAGLDDEGRHPRGTPCGAPPGPGPG